MNKRILQQKGHRILFPYPTPSPSFSYQILSKTYIRMQFFFHVFQAGKSTRILRCVTPVFTVYTMQVFLSEECSLCVLHAKCW